MIADTVFFDVFKNKTVFLTGHTGFIGSWLALWLKSLGSNVVGYSLEPPTKPSLFESAKIENDITHIIGDVRDYELLFNSIKKSKPDFIFHLAAQPIVRTSYLEPIETIQTNLIGSLNVMEAIRQIGCNVSIIMTSDKCYESKQANYACKETDRLGGFDPYSASKAATEIIKESYSQSFFKKQNSQKNIPDIATVRAGNVIGGGDWALDRIVPDCIRFLKDGKKIRVRNPNSIRPWQYVLEPVSGILWLACKMQKKPNKFAEAWNFGPSPKNTKKVKDVVSLILKKWESGDWTDISNEFVDSFKESISLMIDSSKAKKLLGWETVYSIEETISETVDWYKHFIKNSDMEKNSISKIENYIQKAKDSNIEWANP